MTPTLSRTDLSVRSTPQHPTPTSFYVQVTPEKKVKERAEKVRRRGGAPPSPPRAAAPAIGAVTCTRPPAAPAIDINAVIAQLRQDLDAAPEDNSRLLENRL
jgi:hypothetical protein